MPPGAKRKRGDRSYSQDSSDSSNRPSPHRPQNLNMAHQNQYQNNRGGRRPSRGGRGGQQQNPRSPGNPQASPIKSSPTMTTSMPPPVINAPSNMPKPPQPTNLLSTQVTSIMPDRTSTQVAAVKPNLPPYNYQQLNEERRASWQGEGKKAIIDFAAQALTNDDFLALNEIFQEVVRAGLDGTLEPREAGLVVKGIIESQPGVQTLDPISLFLDCVTLVTETTKMEPSLYTRLHTVITSTNINPERVRIELETTTLMGLNFVRSTFFKMGIRNTTSVLYRQAAYNLLREETEGYSKLMTEYFITATNEPPSGAVVANTFQRVKAFIGAFDLDVGRVLDLTLDVFANLLVKYHRFFIKFLRISSWWPVENSYEGIEYEYQGFSSLPNWALPESQTWQTSEEEKTQLSMLREQRDHDFWDKVRAIGMQAWLQLGGRKIISTPPGYLPSEGEVVEKETDQTRDRRWMANTKLLPPPGNKTAAQLLGFKLRFYASDARDEHDSLPDNLIYLAALLIKIGFISLRDLFPHLYPSEDAMPALKERLMKEKADRERKNRSGGALNALAKAGALPDDMLPPAISRLRDAEGRASSAKPDATADSANTPGKSEKLDDLEQVKLPEPVDQRIQLLKSLLCIGCIPEALHILGKYPWFMDVYPELPEYIHRIVHHSISKIYDEIRPPMDPEEILCSKRPVAETSGVPRGQVQFTDAPPRKILRWAQLERNDANGDGIDYRFYWEEWADNIPICQSIEDIFALCNSFMNISGFKLGQDSGLLMKLARIGKKSLASDPSDSNYARWIELSKRLLVPCLSLTKGNPGVVNAVFDLLKMFNTKTRYNMYAEWYTGATSRTPDLKTAFDQTRAETKDVMKKISKTNTKQMAKKLSKVGYGSPGIVFEVALNQMEAYENLVEVVVECARYFTYLAFDVLTWSLMNSLTGKGRDRLQGDGMLTSPWLKALSLFAGKIFKRYSVMNATPVLQYVENQLRIGYTMDLEVLDQILTSMAGVRSDIDLNDAQTNAMAGGELLQTLTLEQVHDKRHESKSISRRLLRSLVDPGLAGQLLIAIARERQVYTYRQVKDNIDIPLKVLGSNLDKIHVVFTQYLDTLRTNLPPKDFNACVPDVVALISEFGINRELAFAISRASILQAMAERDASIKQMEQRRKSIQAAQATGEVEMTDADTPATSDHPQEDTIMQDDAAENREQGITSSLAQESNTTVATNGAPDEPWHPVLRQLMDRLKPVLPSNFEDTMSLSFYVTFWQLGLGDVHSPIDGYDSEIKRQKDKLNAVNSDRTDVSVTGNKKREEKRKIFTDLQDRLRSEMRSHFAAYLDLRKTRIAKEKDHWFASIPLARSEALHRAILQECIIPRVLLSPVDALYTFKMIMMVHSVGTPGFRTLHLLDILLEEKSLASILFQCTAREVENFGRFLNEMFKAMGEWHADHAKYAKEAHGKDKDRPGFALKWKPDRSPETFAEHEDFRRVLYKWHNCLRQALLACFKSDEYMHIRNAIIVLKAVHQHSPPVNFMGKSLHDRVKELSLKETRGDLKLAATSLLGDLTRREKYWVLPQAYRLVEPNQNNKERTASRSGSARPSTPQPATGSNYGLNAAASEFKPKLTAPNGISQSRAFGKEVEDGEIEDARNAVPRAGLVLTDVLPTVNGTAREQELINENGSDQALETGSSTAVSATQLTSPQEESMARPDSQHSDLKFSQSSSTAPSMPPRTDNNESLPGQGTPTRTPHALPNRPEMLIPRIRPGERTADRPPEYHGHGRHESRGPPNPDYGRLDRPGDFRENYDNRREQSPGRRTRPRSPERMPGMERHSRDVNWTGGRDIRPYPDERGPPRPPRDVRPGGRSNDWNEGPRERVPPESRGRPLMDSRGPPPPADSRGRLHPNAPMAPPQAGSFHSRDVLHNSDRGPPNQQLSPADRPMDRLPSLDRSSLNPERAAYLEGDVRGRPDGYRDNRRERGSRPHSPRRGDDRVAGPFPPRADAPRLDHRDDRGPMPDRMSNQGFGPMRDRRDDAPPTEPRSDRGGRNDFSDLPPPPRSRDLFQSSSHGGRVSQDPNHGRLNQDSFGLPPRSQQQDPNYGRLNANSDTIPSGPRGRSSGRGGRNFTAPHSSRGEPPLPPSPASEYPPNASYNDGRDRRSSAEFPRSGNSAPPTPVGETTELSGIHPSRLNQFQPPPLQTDIQGPPPSGPRSALRSGLHNTTPVGSPSTRNPPSGPSTDQRQKDNRLFGGLRGIMQQNAHSTPPPFERSNNDRGGSNRGRGGRPSHGPPPSSSPAVSQPDTPLAGRLDGPYSPHGEGLRPDFMVTRSGHGENNSSQDERADNRAGRRESRRDGEKRTRHRSSRSRSQHRERDRTNREREDYKEKRERGSSDREVRESRRREEGGREREGHRDRDRERREGRQRDDSRRDAGEAPPRRGGPPVEDPTNLPPPHWTSGSGMDGRNGENMRRGGERRDDRERRDGRKRGRIDDPGHESKRPRRSN